MIMKTQMNDLSPIKQMALGLNGTFSNIKPSQESINLEKKYCEKQKFILGSLKDLPELRTQVMELIDIHDLMETNTQEDAYIQGFRFGVLMGMDILKNE